MALVERLAREGGGLRSEPGVSYLISADGRRVLFDYPGRYPFTWSFIEVTTLRADSCRGIADPRA